MADKKIILKFKGVDFWSRPIFKDDAGNYFGSTDKLFKYEATGEEVLKEITVEDITYFGNHFGCEPMGTSININEIKLEA